MRPWRRHGAGERAPIVCSIALCVILGLSIPAAASDLPDLFAGIGIEPRLGTAVPADAPFLDEAGRTVRLADYLGGPPVILAPVYYTCPNLCGSTLADLAFALHRIPLQPGRDYRVVAVSIDPRERPSDAAAAKVRAMTRVASGGLPAAMHFLTGPESSSADIADAIGFRFRWDAELQQYAHVSGVAVLTSDGRLARWLAGIGLEPVDLRLAVAEAGRGGIGGLADRLLLLCAHYDPRAGRYTSVVHGALKIGGVITVLALAIPIAFAVARERRRQRPSERVV